MYRPDGNWRSLDPETAMRGVTQDMSRAELLEVAYGARCGAARRIALVWLDDAGLTCTFAKEDPDPMVRRRLTRSVKDTVTLEYIAENDADASVRETAEKRLAELGGV